MRLPCSETLNVRSEALNVRSKALNRDFNVRIGDFYKTE